jgi:signal transduction histidine kinase
MNPSRSLREGLGRLEGFVLSACRASLDVDCRRQSWLVHGFAGMGILACTAFLVPALLSGRHLLAGILFAVDLVSFGGLLFFRRQGNYLLASSVALGTVGLFFLFLLASGEAIGNGLLWAFIYPPMVMFCLGHRIGLPVVGGFVVLASALVLAPEGWAATTYTVAFKIRWVAALLFVATSSALFEWTRAKTQLRLEAEVAARRKTEGQLQVAKEVAEQAARIKGEFLANMSHELRTPLTSLIGMTDLLVASELRPDQRLLAQTMQRSGHHLVDIVNDILDLSKLEAGQLALEPIGLDPTALTRDVVESFEAVAAARGLSLGLDVLDLPAMVQADPRRIRQVLNNLVGNAVKFTIRGGVEVRVEADTTKPGWARLDWSVRDTGPGVPAHLQATIFDEFRQGERVPAGVSGGTGLGLTISKRLIEAMGGAIGVDSEPGEGARFWFRLDLPLANLGEEETAPQGCTTAGSGEHLRDARLLVAEDDPYNRSLMQLVFERLGAEVELACDGHEAVEKYETGEFDLIVMDCSMPRMDGYEASRAIRQRQADQGRRRIPILAVTANVAEESQNRCQTSGMDGTLLKPFQAEQLERAVAGFLER